MIPDSKEKLSFFLTLLILCLYGMIKEIRPSEPYLTRYLTGPYPNVNKTDVYQKVYPIWTYSYLALLIPVFLLTDLLKYKPVIIFEGLAYIGTWSLLLWGKGLLLMQIMQVVYGAATSTEVAYYTYIYAKVDKDKYQLVSSCTRAAILFGKFLSGLLAQLLYSYDILTIRELNYVSFASVFVAFCVTIFLPPVKSSIYFHNNESNSLSLVLNKMWSESKNAFSNPYLLKWSLWMALSTCGNYQIGNYIQALWKEIEVEDESIKDYNGAVESVTTILGSVSALSVAFLKLDWKLGYRSDFAIISASMVSCVILYTMTSSMWAAYIGYTGFRVVYQFIMTISSYEIAGCIANKDSFGLVFGINLFYGLAFNTLLTYLVSGPDVFALKIFDQFIVYSLFYCATGLIFSIILSAKIINSIIK